MRHVLHVRGVLSFAHTDRPMDGKYGPSYPNRIVLDKEKCKHTIKEIKSTIVKLLKENPPTKIDQTRYARRKMSKKEILKDRYLDVCERSFKDGDKIEEGTKQYYEGNLGKMLLETTSKTPPLCYGIVTGGKKKLIDPSLIGSGDTVTAMVQLFTLKNSGSVSVKLVALVLVSKWKPTPPDPAKIMKQLEKEDAFDGVEDEVSSTSLDDDLDGDEDSETEEDLGDVEEEEPKKKAKKVEDDLEDDEDLEEEDEDEEDLGDVEEEEEEKPKKKSKKKAKKVEVPEEDEDLDDLEEEEEKPKKKSKKKAKKKVEEDLEEDLEEEEEEEEKPKKKAKKKRKSIFSAPLF